MALRLFRSVWGLPPRWPAALSKITAEGFSGIEASITDLRAAGPTPAATLRAANTSLVASVYTSWADYEGAHEQLPVQQHLDNYKRQLDWLLARDLPLVHINVHSGCDSWDFATATDFFRSATAIEQSYGIDGKVSHETHRGRVLGNPWMCGQLLQQLPALHLTLDVSHWMVGAERLLQPDDVSPLVVQRVRHMHTRVGSAQAPQVHDPQAMGVRRERRAHERWWAAVWRHQLQHAQPVASATPEYGPEPYAQPGTPSAHLDNIIQLQAQQLRHMHASQLRRHVHVVRPADESTTIKLPVIDLDPFVSKLSDKAQQREVDKLFQACKDIGFFYTINHGVSESLLAQTRDLAEAFFRQPQAEKDKLAISSSAFPVSSRGYQRLQENITQGQIDWHEGLDFYRELPSDHPLIRAERAKGQPSQLLIAPNLWPSDAFKRVFMEFVTQMETAGHTVLEVMARSLGLPSDYFRRHLVSDSYWGFRCIHYPVVPEGAKSNQGVGEHTDYGCLTMINQDETPRALQVKPRKSREWLFADPMEGALVTNIGDVVPVWTNWLFTSTPHRVTHENKLASRISVPFFFEPNFDSVIEPLPQLRARAPIDGPTASSFVYGEHLSQRLAGNFTFYPTKQTRGQESE